MSFIDGFLPVLKIEYEACPSTSTPNVLYYIHSRHRGLGENSGSIHRKIFASHEPDLRPSLFSPQE